MKKYAKTRNAILGIIKALQSGGCPEDAICFHLGCGMTVDDEGEKLLVEACLAQEKLHELRPGGLIIVIYKKNLLTPVDDQVGLLHMVASLCIPIVHKWNINGPGGSFLFDMDCPKSMREAIVRYHKLGRDVLAPNKEQREKFDKWDRWFKTVLEKYDV